MDCMEHGQSQGSDRVYVPACFCRAERKAEPLPMNKSQERGNSSLQMILCGNTKWVTEKTHLQFLCDKELTKGFQKHEKFQIIFQKQLLPPHRQTKHLELYERGGSHKRQILQAVCRSSCRGQFLITDKSHSSLIFVSLLAKFIKTVPSALLIHSNIY